MTATRFPLSQIPLLALLVAAPSATWAQPASAPASQPDVTARATSVFERAKVQYRLGNFELALKGYKDALALLERPSLVFNIAQCHFQLKQWHQALFHYQHYLSLWAKHHPDEPAPNLSGVHEQIAKIQLILEQEKQGKARPTSIVVKPTTTVVLRDDKGGKKEPKPTRLRIGGLTVAGARVVVDGKLKAVAPFNHLIVVKPGVRTVTVQAKGYVPWRQQVNAVEARDNLVPVDLAPLPKKSRLWLGLTVTTLVLAAGAEAMAVVFHVQAEEHISGTKAFEDDKQMVITGHALAGGLAALSALPLYFYLTSDRVEPLSEEAPPVSASFAPLPGGGMALGEVRF